MARTWIFQCNPERFDIDGYLRANPGELHWLVARYGNEIKLGDTVYLWRSGKDAGIVAETEVIGPVEVRPDDAEAAPFWIGGDPTEPAPRIRLRLRRAVSRKKEVLKRKWLIEDGELRDLSIIRMPTGTNFPVAPELAPRLAALWANTGRDMTYAEVVAALWAYEQVWDKAVSKLEGSPVHKVSRLINRVIPSVYNKLMNLRALDPRTATKGLPGGSQVDEQVWAEFFDPAAQMMREQALQDRFEALWAEPSTGAGQQAPEEAALREALDEEVARLDKALTGKSLDDLMNLYQAQAKKDRPRRRPTRTNAFDRSPLVVLITKRRASFKCEVPSCSVPSFIGGDSHPYVETHHLVPLAAGGEDTIANTACLCALHHREIHCGRDRVELTTVLQTVRAG